MASVCTILEKRTIVQVISLHSAGWTTIWRLQTQWWKHFQQMWQQIFVELVGKVVYGQWPLATASDFPSDCCFHVWNCQLDISGLQRGGQLFKMRFHRSKSMSAKCQRMPKRALASQSSKLKRSKTIFFIVETICITAISANWHVLRNSGKLG